MSKQQQQKLLLNAEQIQQIIQTAYRYIREGEDLLEQKIPLIDIHFDLSGKMAGMYCMRANLRWIRFNPFLFDKYWQENLEQTVPHEVAHYLTDVAFGHHNVKPHGKEWKLIMQQLGATPSTTHQFDVSDLPVKRQRRFPYRCSCSQHQLSTTRHYRLLRQPNMQYLCRQCGEALVFNPEEH